MTAIVNNRLPRWLQLACIILAPACGASAQIFLDQTWTLTVAGQTVQANPDGSFRIGNIVAADRFGPGGPGSPPDSFSDNLVRLSGFSTAGGMTRYVFSEPFRLRQRQVFTVTNLTFTLTPPPFPESLRAAPDQPTLTATGQVTQVRVNARIVGGSMIDVTPQSAWTVYLTSNTNVARVDVNGRVTAVSRGAAFITAMNEGATAVTRIDVSPGDPLTTVRGIVVDGSGAPMTNVIITLVGSGGTTVSGSDGTFAIPGVATGSSIRGVFARRSDGQLWLGFTGIVAPAPAGLTDAGILTVVSCAQLGIDCTDTDNDGLPNAIETLLGLSPTNADTDGDGIPDGEEDSDGDTLLNLAEVVLGTNPRLADSDGDGLADGAEILQHLTSPVRADTDGDSLNDGNEIVRGTSPMRPDTDLDGWNDEAEVTGGSDPLNAASRPKLTIAGLPLVGISLPHVDRSGGGVFGLTLAAPPVSLVLPASVLAGGLASSPTIAQPRVFLALPASSSAGGFAPSPTVAQPPVSLALPAPASAGGLAPSPTIGQPVVAVALPAVGTPGGAPTATTIAQPPAKIRFAP